MELDISTKDLGKEVLERIKTQEQEEFREELRVQLVKGKWFLKGAEAIVKINPVYFDRTGAWWLWNQNLCSWEERDETDILVMCKGTLALLGDTSVKHGSKLLEALRQVSRQQEPKEPPLDWIQFGTTFVNIKTGDKMPSTPDYFSTNPIPWNIGNTTQTPKIDELIVSWVGKKNLQTVHEIIAYCTYRDYPIHRIFCFVGTGANGKTRLLKIIEKFVGNNNKASVTLKKIGNNDFALYPLYRKLVCFVGETAHHRLESTEVIKALCGQDPVSFEAKGRNSFTGQNYAKLIVGTNVLPPSTDTSRGWYRRWFVLSFPNEFEEGEDVLNNIPEKEYENLAAKTITVLPMLLSRGHFATEGSIQERQAIYVNNSNPLKQFLSERYERDGDSRVRYSECYLEYLSFLSERKARRISRKEFSGALEDEGLETQKTSKKDFETQEVMSFNVIWGIKHLPIQRTIQQNIPDIPDMPDVPVACQIPIKEIESDQKVGNIGHIEHTEPINSVYVSVHQPEMGNDRDVPAVVSPSFSIKTPQDILLFISQQDKGIAAEEDIIAALDTDKPLALREAWLRSYLAKFSSTGEIYSPMSGYWSVNK